MTVIAQIDRTKHFEVCIDLDGTPHTFRAGDTKVAHIAALRDQTGGRWTYLGLLGTADQGLDAEVVAGFVFLAGLQAGDTATYDDAVALVDDAEVATISLVGDDAEGDSPEA